MMQPLGEEAKRKSLLDLLRASAATGIVYVATVKAVGELTDFLRRRDRRRGLPWSPGARKRTAAQDRFMNAEAVVMVATTAFGLGNRTNTG